MVKDKWSDLKALVDLSFDLELQKFRLIISQIMMANIVLTY